MGFWGFGIDRSSINATKFSEFIDFRCIAKASRPQSSVISAMRATVFIYKSASDTVILECLPDHALVENVLKVNTASSIQTSFLSLSLVDLTAWYI